ncbi:hypothetical protein [Haloarcula sp. JP-L23]|uniref:hypothetical protein n=1 Tax=Haloarcula sp. JP-L23 TaxID=2716717 RepID=UPI00140EFF5D|nr:hypothetical protein G9465_03300 [Haloarcula sp. JP-L23]
MTEVFLAGPIDFQDVETIVDYRLTIRDRLREAGFEPVDQYSAALELVAETDDVAEIGERLDELPDEPYLDAVSHAVAATSFEDVLADPSLVPEHTPPEVVADIVERDLSLVADSDAFLAYLPDPSCGTMAELLHAVRCDHPTVVVSETPPHFVQYYADATCPTVEEAIETLSERLATV